MSQIALSSSSLGPASLGKDLRSPIDAAVFPRSADDTRRSDFASVLGKVQRGENEDPEAFARRSAESFVSMTFIQPLLKQLRESNHAAKPFAPSSGEKQFQGLMDAELSQRIVHATHFPIVDRVTQDLLKRSKSLKPTGGDAGRTDAPAETAGPIAETPS